MKITAEQRNALYEDIVDRLSAIEDVWLAVRTGTFDAASRLALAYSDELRLVVEDLGWGNAAPSESIELKTPPDVLRRVLERMRSLALGLDASEARERHELRRNHERNHLVVETCEQVLAGLEVNASASAPKGG